MDRVQSKPIRKRILKLHKYKSCPRKKVINLLEHPELVALDGEMHKLEGELHSARKALTEQETRYGIMKQKFNSELKEASEKQQYDPFVTDKITDPIEGTYELVVQERFERPDLVAEKVPEEQQHGPEGERCETTVAVLNQKSG